MVAIVAFAALDRYPSALPHLRKVIAAIPDGTSAVTLDRVMTQPNDELYVDGLPASPRDWLLAGKEPAAVVDIVRQLYAW